MAPRSLAERVGARLLIGFEGTSASPELVDLLREFRLGGILLFKRNVDSPEQVAALTRALQEAVAEPLLIGIDHEGGRVQRLPAPFTILPAALEVGRTGSVSLARRLGELASFELAAVGVNLNFAPVVDVLTHPENQVIGDRAFGNDVERVSGLGAAFIEGHQGAGVAACAKHFPGHGGTETDSHHALPRDRRSLDDFRAVDLPPFRRAIEAGVAAVMTAHVECPAVDGAPATLSRRWIQGILRGELGFGGAVLSDDVEMKALSASRDNAESGFQALRAGCDLLLAASGSLAGHRRWIEALVQSAGELAPEELSGGLERVQALKERWVFGRPFADPRQAAAAVPHRGAAALLAEIHRAAGLA